METFRTEGPAAALVRIASALAAAMLRALHRIADRTIAVALYQATRAAGEGMYLLESALRGYLVRSKYVDDDRFERKLDDDRVVCLWMGLKDAESITLREISFSLGVSDHYARKIRKAAKEWRSNLPRYVEIMRGYRSDSEKGDPRSAMK